MSRPEMKNISLVTSGKSLASVAPSSAHTRGRFAIVTNRWGRGAMDVSASGVLGTPGENAETYGQVVWF